MIRWIKRKFDEYVRSLGYLKRHDINSAKDMINLNNELPPVPIDSDRFVPANMSYLNGERIITNPETAIILTALREYNEKMVY